MSSTPRLIVMTKPPPAVLDTLKQTVAAQGLEKRLGAAMFEPGNWHQTLSARFPDEPRFERLLQDACSRVVAEAFTLSLDRVVGPASDDKPIHWTLLAARAPKGLVALLAAIRSSLQTLGVHDESRHRAHITISYRAPSPLTEIRFTPVAWPVENFLLVRGGGQPYRYTELCRWPLTPAPQSRQLNLF